MKDLRLSSSLFLVMALTVSCFQPFGVFNRAGKYVPSTRLLATTTPPTPTSPTTPTISITGDTLEPRYFLSKLLSSRSTIDEKKSLLSRLQNLRMAGVRESSAPGTFNYAEFLDELLVLIDSVQGNIWAQRRLPIPLPSLRLKMGSAKRLLNTLIQTEEKDTSKGVNSDMDSGKKRRALGILLSQLAQNDGGVRGLELEALTRLSRNTMEEMIERTPKGLETPKYEVVYNKDNFQVRKYDAFAVCSMMLVDQQMQNGPAGFQTLAGYIFGKNADSKAMAMTTPVISSGNFNAGAAGGAVQPKKMSFVMPSAFWADDGLSGAPRPIVGSGIMLETKGGGMIDTNTVAVLWFGGYATKGEISGRISELMKEIAQDGTWKVKVTAVFKTFSLHFFCVYLLSVCLPVSPRGKRRNNSCYLLFLCPFQLSLVLVLHVISWFNKVLSTTKTTPPPSPSQLFLGIST